MFKFNRWKQGREKKRKKVPINTFFSRYVTEHRIFFLFGLKNFSYTASMKKPLLNFVGTGALKAGKTDGD